MAKAETKKSMSAADKAKRIKSLLTNLEKSRDSGVNRKLRQALRKLGHKGGLGKKGGKKDKVKKTAKKKTAKTKAA